ncbi:hypothetical protein JW933_07965 [candidate division FCPU426 bacterium]|nr:hypothetical protein [candidate division FCPU426 bacterium]
MIKYKGTGIKILNHLFASHGQDQEAKFLAILTPEEKEGYENIMATSWVPIDLAARLFAKAAEVLFPGDCEGLMKIGREQALNNLTGIYKILIRITTLNFVLSQTALLWKTYFDQGKAQGLGEAEKKKAILRVTGIPDMPKASRQVVAGYVVGVLELINIKNTKVRHMESNPQCWEWEITW